MSKILHFLKYHNAVSIIAVFLIVAGGSFAASPDLRQGVGDAIYTKTETVISIDNTKLLAADLNAFNPKLHITAISEDDETYYVTYQYETIEIQDAAWTDATKDGQLKVSKALLMVKHRDLGLYVAEELGEVASYQLSLLKESQTRERERGVSQKVAAVAYAGLIGRFLSPEEKVFPGYEPVVPEVVTSAETASVPAPATAAIDPDLIRQIVQEEVARVLAANAAASQAGQSPEALGITATSSSEDSSSNSSSPSHEASSNSSSPIDTTATSSSPSSDASVPISSGDGPISTNSDGFVPPVDSSPPLTPASSD
jgi:hypothetical protein